MPANESCVNRWPTESQSFKDCFSGCYDNIFLFLPSFFVATTKYEIHSLWNEDVTRETPHMVRWRTVKEGAAFGCISEINRALSRRSSDSEPLLSKLKSYTKENGIGIPGEGIGEGILDPFLIATLMQVLRRHGKSEVILSAHGYKETYHLDCDYAPGDVRLIEGQYYPSMLYTNDYALLCKSELDYYCGVVGSTDSILLRTIVEEANLEGFFPLKHGLDWEVADQEIR